MKALVRDDRCTDGTREGTVTSREEGGNGDIPMLHVAWDDGGTSRLRCYEVGSS